MVELGSTSITIVSVIAAVAVASLLIARFRFGIGAPTVAAPIADEVAALRPVRAVGAAAAGTALRTASSKGRP